MAVSPSSDPFGNWPQGQAYQTPEADPVSPPLCRCGSKHTGKVPWCPYDQPEPQEAHDTSD
jgi:hypothetical protein